VAASLHPHPHFLARQLPVKLLLRLRAVRQPLLLNLSY
jgi:hypothetical protein